MKSEQMQSESGCARTEMGEGKTKAGVQYELVPPDGGWGYVICVAFIINCSSVLMFISCFGILYKDFIIELGMNSTTVTLLNGFYSIAFAVAGFLTNSLLKLMSFRKLCLLAVLINDAGAIGVVFVHSIPMFFLCQGIMLGIGLGITNNLSCTIINDYFVKRRMFAFSLVQFFVAVNIMVAPMFVKWSLEEYGFRGTVLLVGGLMLHNIFGVCLMHPVKWHMKKVEVLPSEEIQPLMTDGNITKIPKIKLKDEEKAIRSSEDIIKEIITENGIKSSIRKIVDAFIDVSSAKKFLLSYACMGPSICNFIEHTFNLILPQALYALEWSQDKVALAISMNGFGDLATRTVLMLTSKWLLKLGAAEIYVFGIFVACFACIGMLWSENQYAVLFYIFMAGVARSISQVIMSLVFSSSVKPEQFTQSMGIFMLISGVILLTLGPAVGAARDFTNSYNTAFYILTSSLMLIGLLWSIQLWNVKRKIQKEKLQKIKSSCLSKRK